MKGCKGTCLLCTENDGVGGVGNLMIGIASKTSTNFRMAKWDLFADGGLSPKPDICKKQYSFLIFILICFGEYCGAPI